MLTFNDVVQYTGGRVVHAAPGFGTRIEDVSTDSRCIQPGALFVALKGDRFDGHDYLDDVASRGAVAAVVSQEAPASTMPLVVVDDTRIGLGAIAAGWRARFAMPLVTVAGSNGKTTTKGMIASVLEAAFGPDDYCATAANDNNEIGVAMTLLKLRTHHRAAVVELGMNHPGETRQLATMAKPTVALILNAHREHQEFLRTVGAVAEEHSQTIFALPSDGIAVLPADDVFAQSWRGAADALRVIDFIATSDGDHQRPKASVVARAYAEGDDSIVHLETPAGALTVRLQAPGLHNVRNAAAATAACIAVGIGVAAIQRGLEAFVPVAGRSRAWSVAGATVIDDSYNANPDSMRAAIDLLASRSSPRLLVLGDMGEVGRNGARFHTEIGAHARELAIDSMFTIGDASRWTSGAFGANGRHFDDIDSLIGATQAWVAEVAADGANGTSASPTVLVKGSRFMRMERVVAALRGTDVARDAH